MNIEIIRNILYKVFFFLFIVNKIYLVVYFYLMILIENSFY